MRVETFAACQTGHAGTSTWGEPQRPAPENLTH